MMRPADGSLRGTIKSLEKLKLQNMQKQENKWRRGDGCCLTNLLILTVANFTDN